MSADTGWAARAVPPPGTRVVVAGGCGGIGRVVVAACRELGHRVAVLDLPGSIELHPPDVELIVPTDAADAAQVNSAFEIVAAKFGAIDLLAFLVGFTLTPPRHTVEIDGDQWEDVLRGNLTSAHLVTRAAIPHLRRGTAPNIVLISSGLGVVVLRGYGPYAAAKAGVIALTKALAIEHAPHIRANAIAPAAIVTDFMKGGLAIGATGDDSWFNPAAYIPLLPMGRMAEPADVVGPLLFLASDAASYITGQTIHVNGGRYMF